MREGVKENRLLRDSVRSNGEKVILGGSSYVGVLQCHESFGVTRRTKKLDFKTIRLVNVNDGSDIAGSKSVPR